jgi:hypothetical protein
VREQPELRRLEPAGAQTIGRQAYPFEENRCGVEPAIGAEVMIDAREHRSELGSRGRLHRLQRWPHPSVGHPPQVGKHGAHARDGSEITFGKMPMQQKIHDLMKVRDLTVFAQVRPRAHAFSRPAAGSAIAGRVLAAAITSA